MSAILKAIVDHMEILKSRQDRVADNIEKISEEMNEESRSSSNRSDNDKTINNMEHSRLGDTIDTKRSIEEGRRK